MGLRFRPRVEGLDERVLPDATPASTVVTTTGAEGQAGPTANDLRAEIRWQEGILNNLKAERNDLLAAKAAAEGRVEGIRDSLKVAQDDLDRINKRLNEITAPGSTATEQERFALVGAFTTAMRLRDALQVKLDEAIAEVGVIDYELFLQDARIRGVERYIEMLKDQLSRLTMVPVPHDPTDLNNPIVVA